MPLHRRDVWEAIWRLISRGLAYIDVDQRGPGSWELILTPAGRAAYSDERANPDDPTGYLARLGEDLPELARVYVAEALGAYGANLYRASAVMVGVASEAVFLEMASAFVGWLDGSAQDKFRQVLENRSRGVAEKFTEFRKRLESRRSELPSDLSDSLDLFLSAIFDLIRLQRNDAGHPTGAKVSRDDCFAALEMFVRYAERANALRRHFACPDADASQNTS